MSSETPLRRSQSLKYSKPPASGMSRVVTEYVKRVQSQDLEEYPEWDLTLPLPKLPVPSLMHTMDTYLRVLKPITTEKQYINAERLVKEFMADGGDGKNLQNKLLLKAQNVENWAYDWWLHDMYLNNKNPLPINYNPGMVFPRVSLTDSNDQLRRSLPTDRARHREKGQPLCMEQYYRLFSSYREPGVDRDRLLTVDTTSAGPEHITVIRNNQFFKLDIQTETMRLSEDDICCQLRRISRMSEQATDSLEAVGILTTQPRDVWAQCREHMLTDNVNRENLQFIETSIFILSLDKEVPSAYNHKHSSSMERDDNSLSLQMLHGQGSNLNSCNRWYDKTMQFIIGEDGACGLNYEHSPSEGIAVVQLIEHVLKYMEELRKRKLVRMNSIADLPYPLKLTWNLTPQIKQNIMTASEEMDRTITNLDFYLLRFTDYGKEFPKLQNMSPDCYIQLALQLTYYRLHGHLVSTYESGSTRRYRNGRVDNIRSASCEALKWCEAMSGNNSSSAEDKMSLLRRALKAQNDFMVQTILGHGIDCHMLGLKCVAEEDGLETPELFKDITWSICNKFKLSTSQVNTTLDSFVNYGPVVPDGYGASYNPHSNSIVFCISSWKSCPETRSEVFAKTLEKVLYDIKDMCLELKSKTDLQTIKELAENNNNCTSNGVTEHKSTSPTKDTVSPRHLILQKQLSLNSLNFVETSIK